LKENSSIKILRGLAGSLLNLVNTVDVRTLDFAPDHDLADNIELI
jgi:hypothetical protein